MFWISKKGAYMLTQKTVHWSINLSVDGSSCAAFCPSSQNSNEIQDTIVSNCINNELQFPPSHFYCAHRHHTFWIIIYLVLHETPLLHENYLFLLSVYISSSCVNGNGRIRSRASGPVLQSGLQPRSDVQSGQAPAAPSAWDHRVEAWKQRPSQRHFWPKV